MLCTAEEIAAKRRIALERLKAKEKPVQSASSITAEEIAAKRRIALDRLKAKEQFVQSASSSTSASNSASQFSRDSFKAKSSYANENRVSQPYKRNACKNEPTATNLAPVFGNMITCKCAMLSESRFTVVPTRFHKILIDTFKSIPSFSFDPVKREWSFSLSDYQLIQERVPLIPDVSIGQIPKFVLNLMNKTKIENVNEMEASCLSAIEPILVNSLLPFQKEGVCFGISKQGRCMIADEMGLGKTYQALAIADFYRDDWPLLVCTTAGTRDSWAAKVRELLPSVPCHQIHCMTSMQDFVSDTKVLIVSYNLMERNCDIILKRKFGAVIFDESHSLKNTNTKSTKAALQIAKDAKRVILLTGTPALSRPNELFTQLQMIDTKFFSFREYSLRYCAGKQGKFGWESSGQSNLDELNVLLKQKFMIRRTKEHVLTDLASKSRETIMLDPALIWQDDELKENMSCYSSDISKLKGRAQKDVLLRYYVETGKAKIKAVCAYVMQMLKKDQKFIIFAHHTIMLDAIDDCISKLNVDHIRIDGSTQNDVRSILVNHFQKESKCRVAVLSLLACNTGITLTAAQLVLFAELTWNPSTLAQAESRAHRLGQEGVVTCQYLLARGTADDLIWEMLKEKQDVLSKVGLFTDDLADGTFIMGPVSGEKIDKYIVKTPRKNNDTSEPSGSANILDMNVDLSGNDLQALLDDDDQDLANLELEY